MRTKKLLFAALAATLLFAAGCTTTLNKPVDPNAPVPTVDQVQAARVAQCNRAESMVSIAASSAALAVAKKSQETKDYVAVSVKGLRAGVSDYCDKVLAGQDAAAIDSALKAVQVSLDELTDRLLAPAPLPAPA